MRLSVLKCFECKFMLYFKMISVDLPNLRVLFAEARLHWSELPTNFLESQDTVTTSDRGPASIAILREPAQTSTLH